ncbi:MAG: hypothetical protein PHX83_14045 [Acidobacteriia bacterium]|nr:hypothetical protein [Terriglobia bacterium]
MKRVVILWISVVFGTIVLLAQAPVPVSQEPSHHLKFENQQIKVYDVVVAPTHSTLFHIHANDYAFVVFGDAQLMAQKFGGQEQPMNVRDGDVNYTPATLIHRIRNTGTTTFHNLTIEFLGTTPTPKSLPPLTSGQFSKVALENNRIRIVRLNLKPGQSTGMHTHSSTALAIAVSEGDLRVEYPNKSPETVHTTPGFFVWRDQAVTHSLTNIGKTDFQSVDIEVK